jgi:hypothetical protein
LSSFHKCPWRPPRTSLLSSWREFLRPREPLHQDLYRRAVPWDDHVIFKLRPRRGTPYEHRRGGGPTAVKKMVPLSGDLRKGTAFWQGHRIPIKP